MDSFIQELAAKKVLTTEDIIILKDYIAKKYESHSSLYRAKILSRAVHQILDNNIPAVNREDKSLIKHDILKNTILDNGQNIFLDDIFKACISRHEKSSEFIENLQNWINNHVENKVSKAELESYYIDNIAENPEEAEFDSIEELPSQYSEAAYKNDEKKYKQREYEKEVSSKTKKDLVFNRRLISYVACFLIIFLAALLNPNNTHTYILNKLKWTTRIFENKSVSSDTNSKQYELNLNKLWTSELPDYFRFREIHKSALKRYLKNKHSLLSEEPYFSAIIKVSKEYNLNPLVLFAITGQEQGFVDKQDPYSKAIANNPFNVYHSWKEYNTNIEDACRIACITIIDLSKGRPSFVEPFTWISRKYAEDPNWARSVNIIFNTLEQNDSSATPADFD